MRVVPEDDADGLDYEPNVVDQGNQGILRHGEKETPQAGLQQKDGVKWGVPPKTDKPDEPHFTRKIVAIGDLHGDLPNALKVLKMTKVIDDHDDWSGEVDILVQTGDIIGKQAP